MREKYYFLLNSFHTKIGKTRIADTMLTMTRHRRRQSKNKLKLKLNKIKIDFLQDDVIHIIFNIFKKFFKFELGFK